jgi:hypothetical protein
MQLIMQFKINTNFTNTFSSKIPAFHAANLATASRFEVTANCFISTSFTTEQINRTYTGF